MSRLIILVAFAMSSQVWAQDLSVTNLDLLSASPAAQSHKKEQPKAEAKKKFKPECTFELNKLKEWAAEDYPGNRSITDVEFGTSTDRSIRLKISPNADPIHVKMYAAKMTNVTLLSSIAKVCRTAPREYTARLNLNGLTSGLLPIVPDLRRQVAFAMATNEGISIDKAMKQKYFTISLSMRKNGDLTANFPGMATKTLVPLSNSKGAR